MDDNLISIGPLAPTVRKPCPECAFLKTCPPGLLGGSPVETYIGQIIAPFAIPCHMQCNFDDPEWKAKGFDTRLCAGAAIMRTHVHAPRYAQVEQLPASVNVFPTFAEFMAHHCRISLDDAKAQLQTKTPGEHARDQMRRADNMVRAVPRPPR